MKISLVGICQVVGMAAHLRQHFPEVEIFSYHVQPNSDVNEITARLVASDLIISQILPEHGIRGFDRESLLEISNNVFFIPPLVFSGFHPDMMIIPHRGIPLDSPIEVYHSRIIAAAYSLGLPETQAANILNSLTFRRLGYFGHFEAAKQVFFELLRPYQLEDFAKSRWNDWMSQGAFMHTPNHPKTFLLRDFALLAAESIGLQSKLLAGSEIEDIFDDQHGCPVYPEIARYLGVRGDVRFRTYNRASDNEKGRYMDIHRYAKSAYHIYHSIDRNDLLVDPSIRIARSVIKELVLNHSSQRR